jgi:virginiamycin B lyase
MRAFMIAAALIAAVVAAPALHGQAQSQSGVQVTFDDWTVPTPNSHPHDPAFGPDNTLWYTGQVSNKLGRVDMGTGQFKEFDLPRGHGPHGLVSDRDGNIWYTANFGGAIARLDPKTGQITEYKMPDPAARDPHTPIFAPDGTLWFTVQGGNFVGKLEPRTGAVTLKPSPAARMAPYGIVVNSKGVPFFDFFGTNKIGSIDPKTMAITEYMLPNPQSRPRRIAIGASDVVWYTDYSRGYLGRLDPQTKQVKEYPSPAGANSDPYGITTTADGVVWYSESGPQPNTLVRFDPRTETFQKWDIPSGGGVVRHMVTAPNGDLLLAYSGVNKVGRVRIRAAARQTAE